MWLGARALGVLNVPSIPNSANCQNPSNHPAVLGQVQQVRKMCVPIVLGDQSILKVPWIFSQVHLLIVPSQQGTPRLPWMFVQVQKRRVPIVLSHQSTPRLPWMFVPH